MTPRVCICACVCVCVCLCAIQISQASASARASGSSVRTWLDSWHACTAGLTGSPAQIQDCCKKFRVYANKSVLGDKPDEYLIDHSVLSPHASVRIAHTSAFVCACARWRGSACACESLSRSLTSICLPAGDVLFGQPQGGVRRLLRRKLVGGGHRRTHLLGDARFRLSVVRGGEAGGRRVGDADGLYRCARSPYPHLHVTGRGDRRAY